MTKCALRNEWPASDHGEDVPVEPLLQIAVAGAVGVDMTPDRRGQARMLAGIIHAIQAFHTARRTIPGFEAMLWLRKGFNFAGAWTVCEQNRMLSVCFGLPAANKA